MITHAVGVGLIVEDSVGGGGGNTEGCEARSQKRNEKWKRKKEDLKPKKKKEKQYIQKKRVTRKKIKKELTTTLSKSGGTFSEREEDLKVEKKGKGRNKVEHRNRVNECR